MTLALMFGLPVAPLALLIVGGSPVLMIATGLAARKTSP
jgi:hypothetical protein